MSMIAMAHPVSHAAFKREFAWDEARMSDYPPRPRSEERMTLPSIRQAVPEIQLRLPEINTNVRHPGSAMTSPVTGFGGSVMTPPEYVQSPNPNKRRRLSISEEGEERERQIPRLYTSPPVDPQLTRGASPSTTTMVSRSTSESWPNSTRTSPYHPQGSMPTMPSPVTMETPGPLKSRPTLPSFPHLNFDREPIPMPKTRHSTDDAYMHAPRPVMMHPAGSPMEVGPPPYRQNGYPFAYHHPNRVQSLSLGAIHPLDRSPFSAAHYGHYHQDYRGHYEFGGMGMNGDNKQRKRRGNLPKETTDKLRNWLHGHLEHPYPSEDEKQELMRQTGLQMNQISNWFINARRRQMPHMQGLSTAQVETDMSARRGVVMDVAKVLIQSTEPGEFDDAKRSSVPLSEGDGSTYDDDMENLKRRQVTTMKRGSV